MGGNTEHVGPAAIHRFTENALINIWYPKREKGYPERNIEDPERNIEDLFLEKVYLF
jgi:hypothetical protein